MTATSNKMKLFADRTGREVLRCLMIGCQTGVELDVIAESRAMAVGAVDERPSLHLNEDQHVISSYAICRYLLSINNSTSSKTNQMSTKCNGISSSNSKWEVERLVFWTISVLQKELDGVNMKSISESLDTLEELLNENKGYLIDSSLSLADVFVWSAIRTSRIYQTDILTLGRNKLNAYLNRVEITPSVTKAVELATNSCCLPQRLFRVPQGSPKETFYLTSAINYTNGNPHMGHAYEGIMSDIVARYQKIFGKEVFFLAGTDEHGQKIAEAAELQGMTPKQMCDMYSTKFKDLNSKLSVVPDRFIRTTDKDHYEASQKIWNASKSNGDIYLGTYSGWYNIREETFVTEREAQLTDYKDPTTGKELTKMEESSYFFTMSRYHSRLVEHIQSHPNFILPDYRRNEILSRLKEPLTDLSISRATFTWGVPVPGDDKHVMYVWFDALTNYLTGCGYNLSNMTHMWPPNVQIIGKDIIWFHCVIWPCMLMSANLPLPTSVFAHGFVHDGEGKKMSKSIGNVIDPYDILQEFPSDTFRYFIAKEAKFGRDLRFDKAALIDTHNSDLADTLGNLLHRGTSICQKFCEGVIPDVGLPDGEPPFEISMLTYQVHTFMSNFCVQEALECVMSACKDLNKYLTDRAPWAMKDANERQKVCRAILEALYFLGHLLEPFIPNSANIIFERLGTLPKEIRYLSCWFDNLVPGAPVSVGDILFVKK